RLMSGRRVGKGLQGLSLALALEGHDQFLFADFHAGKIKLVHKRLLRLGCGCGSPTLSPLQSSLRIQAYPRGGASDSPRLGRRGRGAYLPSRLSTRGRASAQIGLPATPIHQPSERFLTQNQDTSADLLPKVCGTFLVVVVPVCS